MATLHIMTSAKGGIGKTLCAISAVAHFRQNGITVIDTNWNNPDISRILSFGNPTPTVIDGLNLWGGGGGGHIQVVSQSSPFLIPHGAIGLWDMIDRALNHANAQMVVVDTNLHIANLWPIDDNSQSNIEVQVQDMLVRRGINTVFVWFLWTVAALSRPQNIRGQGTFAPDITYASSVVGELEKVFQAIGCDVQVIHILNPYALVPERSLWDLILNNRAFPVEALRKLARGNITDPVAFDKFSEVASIAFGNPDLQGIETPEAYLALCDEIERSFHGRPKNVFPIPTFSSKVVNYIDHGVLDHYRDWKSLFAPLTELTPDIGRFIDNI